jgi:hypothetical protein
VDVARQDPAPAAPTFVVAALAGGAVRPGAVERELRGTRSLALWVWGVVARDAFSGARRRGSSGQHRSPGWTRTRGNTRTRGQSQSQSQAQSRSQSPIAAEFRRAPRSRTGSPSPLVPDYDAPHNNDSSTNNNNNNNNNNSNINNTSRAESDDHVLSETSSLASSQSSQLGAGSYDPPAVFDPRPHERVRDLVVPAPAHRITVALPPVMDAPSLVWALPVLLPYLAPDTVHALALVSRDTYWAARAPMVCGGGG